MLALRCINVPLQGMRLLKSNLGLIQVATITGRGTRGGPLKLPKPFPYEEKKFRWYHEFMDPTIIKVSEENAKIIVVEGPIGVGKTSFCKILAEEFDMIYMPPVSMDLIYKPTSGLDVRKYDDQLPKHLRTYDHKNFCVEPKTPRAGLFQVQMMNLKFYQYMDAMCHILNTGQGVVLERSYFSDYVFMKAMNEQKFVSKELLNAYLTIRRNTSTFFPAPHLIIYLDIPVPVVQERIRTRNLSYEQNSPALTTDYLMSLEKFWKKDYLPKANETSELLIYDWTDGGDVDVVVDDIEKIDFDILRRDKKFEGWWFDRIELYDKRYDFTNKPVFFGSYFHYEWSKIDEAFIPIPDREIAGALIIKDPHANYDLGYNIKTGNSFFNVLFKANTEKHRDKRYHLNYPDILK